MIRLPVAEWIGLAPARRQSGDLVAPAGGMVDHGTGDPPAIASPAAGGLLSGRGPLVRLAVRLESERDRWFLAAPAAMGAGIGLYFATPREPPVAIALAIVAAALVLRHALRKGTLEIVATGLLLAFALGFCLAKLRAEWVAAPVIGRETAPVELRGRIERLEPRGKGARLTLRVASIEGIAPADTPYRVRIRVNFDDLGDLLGQAVKVRAVLQPPAGPDRPGGYDFARLAWFARIGATGFAVARPEPDLGSPPFGLLDSAALAIERLRQRVGARIREALPGDDGSVVEALVTGERGAIPDEVIDNLRDSGLAHILAISGFNMAIMAGALFGAVRGLLALVPRLALKAGIRRIAALAGFIGAAFCLVVSGAGSATARAFVMIALMLLASLLSRPALSMRNLATAGLVLLAIAPEQLLDAGFQMSFAAVVALMSVYEAYAERRDLLSHWGVGHGMAGRVLRYVSGTVVSTVIAGLAVAPLAVFHFQRLAAYGVIANVVAVPLFAFLIMPLMVVALIAMPLGLEAWPLIGVRYGLRVMLWVADWVAGSRGRSSRSARSPPARFR
ncbi:MAG: ComEC/Rec2 family competence protein [Hyphomicrobiaceae bacterium]